MNRVIRQIHYWGTLLVAIPLLIVAATGVLLQVKKQWSWVQPAEQKGGQSFGNLEGAIVDFDTMLKRMRDCQLAHVETWEDVQRIDIRPSKGIAKITTKDSWEIQMDLADGRVLQEAIRRSDWIESMHDGSFFGGDTVKLGLFLPAGIVMLAMWATGLWLFWLPISVKRRRAKRAKGLASAAAVFVLLQVFGNSCFGTEPRKKIQKPERPPNIVFVLSDDLGVFELGCYGQTKIKTPNIDRLAREGMRFTQHYSGAPVCAPSRCVLMTGKHLGHAQIRGNKQAKVHFPEFTEGQHPITDDAVTIAEMLKKSGYVTGGFGKWGLGPVGSTGDPNQQGFDRFFGYNCQAIAHSYYPEYLWDNDRKVKINSRPKPGHRKQLEGSVIAEDWVGERYAPDLMMEQAELFISEQKEHPFFLYFPCIEPHVAMHPPVQDLEAFPADWDTKVYRGENGYLPHPRPRAAYAAMVQRVDQYVGRLLDALDRNGLTENTLVIFSSDNGPTHPGKQNDFHIGGADPKFFHSTGNLRGFKGDVYEGGIRVPMIARWPGRIPAGREHDAPSCFADWFPTLCEVGQVSRDEFESQAVRTMLDGESLLPVLEGKIANGDFHRNLPMVWVFPEYSGQVAVRFDNFKLIRRGLAKSEPEGWELYDLSSDPSESINIAGNFPEVVELGKKILLSQTDVNSFFPVRMSGAGW